MEPRNMRWGRLLRLAVASAAICAAPHMLLAQANNATLSGTVVDPTHAVIPGATVKLTNVATGDVRTTKSNGTGDFTFVDLPSANFTLTVRITGFQVDKVGGIHLDPGDSRNLHEIILQPGSTTQTVTVKTAADEITLDSGTSSTLISAQDIKHLAVEGRDVTELLKILPGFSLSSGNNSVTNTPVNDPAQVSVAGGYGNYSAEGTISSAIEELYDGIDITDPGNYGGSLQNINYDQVAEVKVDTSGVTADNVGGPVIINAVGKSGTSQFHGEVYTYGRTYQMNSVDWLTKYDHQGAPPDREIYPGFALSGPILLPHLDFNHNRHLTFFAGLEGYFQKNEYAYGNSGSAIVTALVPTAAMRNGDFSQAQLNQYLGPLASNSSYANLARIPATGLDGTPLANGQLGSNLNATQQALINTLPLPNQATVAQGYNYAHTNLIDNDNWQGQLRIDDQINKNNRLFVMYSTERGKEGVPQVPYYSPHGPTGGTNTPGGGMLADLNSEIGTLNLTTILSPTMTNQLSLSGAYFDQDYVLKDPAALTLNGQWNFSGIFNNGSKVIPEFQDYGYNGLPVNLYPDTSFGGIYAKKWDRYGEDDITKVLGRHTLRGGIYVGLTNNHQATPFVATNGAIDMYYIGSTYNDAPNGTTEYSTGAQGSGNGGNYLADFLEGGVFQYSQTNLDPAPNIYFWNIAGYVQDHYRVTPYITLQYGVRIDDLAPWSDAHGIGIPVWDPSTYTTGQNPTLPGFLWHGIDKSIPDSGINAHAPFIEPRVGFAWDMRHNGQTVLRAGFGLYTSHDSANDVETPASEAVGQRTVQLTGPFLYQQAVPELAKSAVTGSGFTPTTSVSGFKMGDDLQPQIYTYNVDLDQRTIWHSLFQIAYIGNISRHLLDNGSTQPVTTDNINAIPIGGLYKADPITGQTYPLACPPGSSSSSCTAISGLSQQQVDDFRPYPEYNALNIASHRLYANYNSLQVTWNKQQGPLTFGINYTWSKALGVWGASNNGTPGTPFDLHADYGPEAFDRRNAFNATYAYTVGKVFHQRLLAGLANHWMISGITTAQSGSPLQASWNPDFGTTGSLNILYNGYKANIPVSAQELLGTPDVYLMPQVTCNPAATHGSHVYINNSCFSLPTQLGQQGPYQFHEVAGPAYFDTDLSLQKSFALGGSRSVLVRYTAFNFLNHANSTLDTNVEPNNLILNYTNFNSTNSSTFYQSLPNALASATNSNANVFGTTNIKIGRRISEVEVKFNF
uniref:TonB-dependent transporter Oar-like beta-barrel domain-containing protein n=1 Tax=Acidobacterium capsulatum TaxID=33075 RepID=A0A7V5CSL4_9BACT